MSFPFDFGLTACQTKFIDLDSLVIVNYRAFHKAAGLNGFRSIQAHSHSLH